MPKRRGILYHLFLTLLLLAALPAISAAQPKPQHFPIFTTFVENAGQLPESYAFDLRASDYRALLLREGADLFVASKRDAATRLTFRLVGERDSATISGRNQIKAVSNFFHGNDPSKWIHGAHEYQEAAITEIYPGIDLVFHTSGRKLEEDFEISASADPSLIAFHLGGADTVKRSREGDLVLTVGRSALRLNKPFAFQENGASRTAVTAEYVLRRDGTAGFRLGRYDHSRPLVIDPVIVFSSYFGAYSSSSQITSSTTDQMGNIYVTGTTQATDFPTVSPTQSRCASCTDFLHDPDAFISEFDPTGQTLLFSTYLGGSKSETAGSIAIAPDGSIVVSGTSLSSDFPVAGQTVSTACQINEACFFLASFKPDGSGLNFCGLFGGSSSNSDDPARGPAVVSLYPITVDGQENTYLAGDSFDFPLTPGTLDANQPGYPYGFMFIAKVNPAGLVLYSTAIPNTADSSSSVLQPFGPGGLAVDANGQVTVSGTAGLGLPVTAGALLGSVQNSSQAQGFILQLNGDASALNFASYIPGVDYVDDIAIDKSGAFLLAGVTMETNLPVSSNAYQSALTPGISCRCYNGFVMKLDARAQSILGATYLSGNSQYGTYLLRIGLDSQSNIFVGGITATFPMVNPVISQQRSGVYVWSPVVAELSPDLSSLEFSSFFNGVSSSSQDVTDFGDITVDHQDHLIVVGSTIDDDFPTTVNSFQQANPTMPAFNQLSAGLIMKLDTGKPAPSLCFGSEFVSFPDTAALSTSNENVSVTNCGNAQLHISAILPGSPDFAVTNSCGAVAPGSTCSVPVTFTPPTDVSDSDVPLTFFDDAAIPSSSMWVSGNGTAAVISPIPTILDFGTVLAGGGTGSAILNIEDFGNGGLILKSATVVGSDFSLVQPLQSDPAPCNVAFGEGAVCQIAVQFAPTATGLRQGALQLASNDPATPVLSVPLKGVGVSSNVVPVITSILPPTAQVGTAPVTLHINGYGFSSASTITINGQSQAATVSTDSSLSVTLGAPLLSTSAALAVTVSNPAPGGGTSNPYPLTVYQAVPIDAVAAVYVPATNLIYAAIPDSAPSSVLPVSNPNTVIPVSPATGATGTPISVGQRPLALAASSDGKYLFVAAQGDQEIQRVNLQTNSVEATYPFPTVLSPNFSQISAMRTVPGDSQSVVVAFSNPGPEVALYSGNGLESTVALSLSGFTFFAGSGTIYGMPFEQQSNFFPIITLDSQGLHYAPGTTYHSGAPATGFDLQTDGSLLYTSSGQVWSPASGLLIGSFNPPIPNLLNNAGFASMDVDASSATTLFSGVQAYGQFQSVFTLSTYDNATQNLLSVAPFACPVIFPLPLIPCPNINFPGPLFRWGTDGLAFTGEVESLGENELFLTHIGSASTPLGQASLLPANLDFGTVGAGVGPSAPQFVTLANTGSGPLLIGSIAVEAFPAFSQTNNCGTTLPAGASCTIAVTFSPAWAGPQTAPLQVNSSAEGQAPYVNLYGVGGNTIVTSVAPAMLSFASQIVGTSSSAQTISLSNTGNARAAFGDATINGAESTDFHMTSNCPAEIPVAGSCAFTVTFEPTASGARSANLVVVDSSQNSPHTIVLSGTATDFTVTGPSASVTVTAGQPAAFQLNLVTVGAPTSNSISFSASGNPAGTTVSFSPQTIPVGTSTASTIMTVTTSARPASAGIQFSGWQLTHIFVALLFLATCGKFCYLTAPRTTNRRRRRAFATAVVTITFLAVGCGGGSAGTSVPQGTPAGTYTITVTATSGAVSRVSQVTLVVD